MMISVFSGLCPLRSMDLWPDNHDLQASMVTEAGTREMLTGTLASRGFYFTIQSCGTTSLREAWNLARARKKGMGCCQPPVTTQWY